MGSSSSKVAGKAAAAAGRRQYPSTSSILDSTASTRYAASPTTSANKPIQPIASARVRPDVSSAPPSSQKSEHIDLDGRDPHFGSALRKIGPAIPTEFVRSSSGASPNSSKSPPGPQVNNFFPANPATNPSLMTVKAGERIGRLWEAENESLGRKSFAGRTMISAKQIKEVLKMRDQGGMQSGEIERQLRLKSGVMNRLGGPGLVANV